MIRPLCVDVPRRGAHPRLTRWHVLDDDCADAHGCACADLEVLADAGVGADPRSVSDFNRAGYLRASDDDAVAPDPDVVGDVDEVVDPRPGAYHRVAVGTA